MYENAIAIPNAKLTPIPPLRLVDDTATAIMVSINAETGTLYFLYLTTKYELIFDEPRILSRSINLFNSLSCIVSRSEEHTSELQSRPQLVCRLLLEKKIS